MREVARAKDKVEVDALSGFGASSINDDIPSLKQGPIIDEKKRLIFE